MKTIIIVLAMVCLGVSGFGQKIDIAPYNIDERITDIQFTHIINYKDNAATFSSFGRKLIILDFWHTRCSGCIAMFPLEDSLQKRYKDKLQFILVTAQAQDDVVGFVRSWDSLQHTHLSLPIITEDLLLHKMFRHSYNPHYVWLAPNGKVLAQTSSLCINAATINGILQSLAKDDERSKAKKYPEEMFHFPATDPIQSSYLKLHKH